MNASKCFWGSCSYVNLSTCMQVTVQENITTQPISKDIDGCFSTNFLRSTAGYHQYKMVSRLIEVKVKIEVLMMNV